MRCHSQSRRRSPARRWLSNLALAAAMAVAGLPAALVPAPATAQQAAVLEFPMDVRYNVRIPVRDGVELSADVYRPLDDAPHPTIFLLTPYNNLGSGTMEEAWRFVDRGYAYVTVDVRGRYDSDGDWFPWSHDSEDGSDVMDWISEQPWSNGEVATMGGSYLGMVQWLMAKEGNPAHTAMVSYVSPADGFNDAVRYNGVPKVDLIFTWSAGRFGHVDQPIGGWDWKEVMKGLPLTELGLRSGRPLPFWREWMEHEELDAWWDPVQMAGHYDQFDVPSFNVTGWWDGQLVGATQNYVNAVATASDPDTHKLIIGPWLHGVNRNRVIGERDYGPDAIIDLDRLRDAWLDHVMLGAAAPDQPNVRYFVQGANEWKTADAWPIPGTRFTEFHLDSDGNANTLLGDGVLRHGSPGDGPPDAYTYNPADPVPTISSRTSGSRSGILPGSVDNRAVETRQDVLTYTTPPLQEGLEVTGALKATIYFETDVPDTDITIKLLEVLPDGRALNLTHGIARAKYRDSFAEPRPLEEGQVYGLEVELFPTSNWFAPGHRIRIEVSSSNFPLFGRNLNTMCSEACTEMRPAHTKIHHSAEYPSSITLPIVPDRIAAYNEG